MKRVNSDTKINNDRNRFGLYNQSLQLLKSLQKGHWNYIKTKNEEWTKELSFSDFNCLSKVLRKIKQKATKRTTFRITIK